MKRVLLPVISIFILVSGCQRQQSQPLVVPADKAQPASSDLSVQKAIQSAAPSSQGTGAEAFIALGNDMMDAQRSTEAIAAYQKALEIDPKNVNVRVDLGTCFRGVGQSDKALAEYRKALEIDPRHANANRNSGVVLANDLHRPAEAVKFFEKYLEVSPDAADAAQISAEVQALKSAK